MRSLFKIRECLPTNRAAWALVTLLLFSLIWLPPFGLVAFSKHFFDPNWGGSTVEGLRFVVPIALAALIISFVPAWFVQGACVVAFRRWVYPRLERRYGAGVKIATLMSPRRLWARPRIRRSIIAVCLLVLVLVPLPLSVTTEDKERAVVHAIETLLEDRQVFTEDGYSQLNDTQFVSDEDRLYFRNGLGIPDTVFLELGLMPVPRDRDLDVDSGDVIVGFSYNDIVGEPSTHIQFYYFFGSLAAQGYEIRIRKGLLFRYFTYVHRWIS